MLENLNNDLLAIEFRKYVYHNKKIMSKRYIQVVGLHSLDEPE